MCLSDVHSLSSLRNPMVPFILLCDAWNMLKYAFELYVFFHARIQKNEMSYKSAMF